MASCCEVPVAAPASSGCVSSSRSRDGGRRGEFRFVDGALQRLFERHHQLDSLERTQAQLVERGGRFNGASRCESADHGGHRRTACVVTTRGEGSRALTSPRDPLSELPPFQFPRALRARKLTAAPATAARTF